MDKTYCTVHMSDVSATFTGFNADKYTSTWDDIRNARYNIRMDVAEELEKRLAIVRQELAALQDDRAFWQKLCGVKTEISIKRSELENEVCCILDDISVLKADTQFANSELWTKLLLFLTTEDFITLDLGCQVQVWTKVHK